MKTITAAELSQLKVSTDDVLLLDVREPHEFEYCHIEGSTHMPMQSVPNRLSELPKNKTIVAICHHGMRSQQVAQFLLQNGFSDIVNLTGGVNAWANDVDKNMPTY
ncbi:MAG: rhodanese [Cycloclasticus sp. symbiont of Poecilosclerida sp. M]|nr:MAG: rhodanese [Cycloclasticus sp. symbiont of Poecilosclerida sp. M]